MSQNSDPYQLTTAPSSSSPDNIRLSLQQQFLPLSDFTTTIQNDSSSPQSYTVRYIHIIQRRRRKPCIVELFFFLYALKKKRLYERKGTIYIYTQICLFLLYFFVLFSRPLSMTYVQVVKMAFETHRQR